MLRSLLFAVVCGAVLSSAFAEGNAVDQGEQSDTPPDEFAEPTYEFVYQVGEKRETGDFGHKEARDGGRTWGSYFQQLPDGRLQTVKYWADESGYHAEIEYEGTAKPWIKERNSAESSEFVNSPRVSTLSGPFPREPLRRKPQQAP